MKTPTLIVRLTGLYLLVSNTVGLLQLHKAKAMMGTFGTPQMQLMVDMQLYLWLGLLVGLAATVFAGFLARLLTFDSEPGGGRGDYSERFLGR
jgi:hypothetical protein